MNEHVLLIANETVDDDLVSELFADRDESVELVVVAPALSGRVDFLTSDDHLAQGMAEVRLSDSLASLRRAGVEASGWVGDDDPLLALEDALRVYDADQVVILTYPPWASHSLERELVRRATERSGLPVRHVLASASRLAA